MTRERNNNDEHPEMKSKRLPVASEGLSPVFKQFLAEESIRQRAWAMVDAMLEEDPGLDREKAFQEALRLLENKPPGQSSD